LRRNSEDSETSHANENVGYLVIGSSGGVQQMSFSSPALKSKPDTTDKKKEKEEPVEPRIRIYPNPTGGNLTVEFQLHFRKSIYPLSSNEMQRIFFFNIYNSTYHSGITEKVLLTLEIRKSVHLL